MVILKIISPNNKFKRVFSVDGHFRAIIACKDLSLTLALTLIFELILTFALTVTAARKCRAANFSEYLY